MPNVVVTVSAVEPRAGTSKKTGKPYTKYVIHANGQEFSTFSESDADKATGLVGHLATVNYTVSNYGNDLGFIDPAPAGAVAAEAIKARDENGGVDWDEIGLRKTRCLLWAHYLGSETAKAVIEATAEGKAEACARVGARLVELAEFDIYHREPAVKDAAIPF